MITVKLIVVSRPSFLKLNANSMFATYQLMYKKRSKSCDRIHDTRVIKKINSILSNWKGFESEE